MHAQSRAFGELEQDIAQRFGLVDAVDRDEILRGLEGLPADDLA